MNKNIGIVITDGVGYRNFVMSNFIEKVAGTFENVTIFSGLPSQAYDISLIPENVTIIDLPVYRENNLTWFFRKLKEVAHMYLHREYYGINDNLIRGYPKNNSIRALLIKLIYLIAKFFHSEKLIFFYEKIQLGIVLKEKWVHDQYGNILKNKKLDILFFTHQRPPYLVPILALAKKFKIKTTSFIFSWDNLASKGRMLGEFDSYLVWSNLMKKELLQFYPKTKDEKVVVVGTPQFEPYVMDQYNTSKENFLRKFNLDSQKKIICYSCADADIGRNDEIHIRALINYIKEHKDLQLIIRTSPAEDGKRFKKLQDEFAEVKWNFPKWVLSRSNHVEAWSQRLPSIEDMVDLKSILQYSDVNVNMLSTMSLDFMLFDKPIINTVFGNKDNGLYDDQRFLNYAHYKYVVDSHSVVIAKNQSELFKGLDEALKTPEKRKIARKNILDLEIGASLEGTSERIANVLQKI